ncbi:MAG: translation initiation factor IF-5A [Candidatus Woesearchaeota archaeon]|jgi:translation initiation factor 5A|nr:translation initiation factor IF-5A [Candidatus Woesearchaeota archaeon]
MAGTKLTHVGSIKKGNYVCIEGVACVVKDIQVSRPGKHGHAKIRVSGAGLMDGRRREVVMPGHDNIEVPVIDKLNGQVLSISGDVANLMDMETYVTFDLKIPEELKDTVKDGAVVVYWDILGEKVMKQLKGAE